MILGATPEAGRGARDSPPNPIPTCNQGIRGLARTSGADVQFGRDFRSYRTTGSNQLARVADLPQPTVLDRWMSMRESELHPLRPMSEVLVR